METSFPKVEQHQCPGCRADMVFNPAEGQLECPYCGRLEALPEATQTQLRQTLQENDLLAFVNANQTRIAKLSTTAQEADCPGCRATIAFEPPEVAGRCPFCGTSIVTQAKLSDPTLSPAGVIPFEFGRKAALQALRDWLAFRWDWRDWQAVFLPGQLKKLAQQESLVGVYLPFWTYDAQTETDYTGERGEHYYVTRKNSDGEEERVRKTRWYRVSGHVSRFFDDVLVAASRSVDVKRLGKLWRSFEAQYLKPYRAEYLAGFKAQRYQISLKEGVSLARQTMEAGIRSAIRADIGGDEQRIHSTSTDYSQPTFKHILLPVWMLSYRYRGKVYQVMVNGQNGELLGDRPFSPWKVAFGIAIATAVGVLILVIRSN